MVLPAHGQEALGGGGPGSSGTAASTAAPGSDSTAKPKLPKSDPRHQRYDQLSLQSDTFYTWDSTLPMVQRYNKIRASGEPFADLGYYASPQVSRLLQAFTAPGLQTGFNPYPFQNKQPDDMVFHDARIPLTRFSYFQGAGGFVSLDAMHTQNIRKGWNISLDYSSLNNKEFYEGSRQDHLHRATRLGSAYTGKNGRYRNFVILTWNRARRNENGGQTDDTLLYRDKSIDSLSGIGIDTRGFFYPELNSARSYYGSRHHILEQQYSLKSSGFYLFHRVDWTRTVYRYSDDTRDTGFYGAGYWYSNGNINDSSAWNGLSNRAGAGLRFRKAGADVMARAWYSHEWMGYTALHFLSDRDLYYSQGLHGLMQATSGKFKLRAAMDQYFDGYNAGDRKLTADAELRISPSLSINAGIGNQVAQPALFFRRFFNNHFRVLNDFSAIKSSQISAGITWKSKYVLIEGLLSSGQTEGLIYSNGDAGFLQAGTLNYSRVQAHILLRAGAFHTDHRILLQRYSDQNVFPAPAFSTLSSFYLQGKLFRKAMLARAGVDVSYWSSYNAMAYRPDLAWFYISRGGRQAGNYPVADLFFSGEVKTVIFTVKLEHWNNYIVNYGASNAFMSARDYAIEPLRLLIGVVWRFHY